MTSTQALDMALAGPAGDWSAGELAAYRAFYDAKPHIADEFIAEHEAWRASGLTTAEWERRRQSKGNGINNLQEPQP